jgi:hypothetical protein
MPSRCATCVRVRECSPQRADLVAIPPSQQTTGLRMRLPDACLVACLAARAASSGLDAYRQLCVSIGINHERGVMMSVNENNPLKISAKVLKRFDEELLEIRRVVQAVLVEHGELDQVRDDWTFKDLVDDRPSAGCPVRSKEYRGLCARVIAAAKIVHDTHASLFGVRERAAAALRSIAAGLDVLAGLEDSGELANYLQNASVINTACDLVGLRRSESVDSMDAMDEGLSTKPLVNEGFMVPRDGIEPPTRGFSILVSEDRPRSDHGAAGVHQLGLVRSRGAPL